MSMIAPQVFDTYFEWQIALVGGYLLAVILLLREASSLPLPSWHGRPARLAGAGIGLALVIYSQTDGGSVLIAETRSFYGEVAVVERDADEPDDRGLAMVHGSIIHGIQFTHDKKRLQPTTYYHTAAGVGRALRFYSDRPDAARRRDRSGRGHHGRLCPAGAMLSLL